MASQISIKLHNFFKVDKKIRNNKPVDEENLNEPDI
jgi:hypothetical protein